MNDDQLVELVKTKLPEELTLDEIGVLNDRLRQSRSLREVLLEQLEMEPYLTAALARGDVSMSAILQQVKEDRRRERRELLFTLLGGVIVLLLVGAAAVAGLTRPWEPRTATREPAAAADVAAGDKEEGSPDSPATALSPASPPAGPLGGNPGDNGDASSLPPDRTPRNPSGDGAAADLAEAGDDDGADREGEDVASRGGQSPPQGPWDVAWKRPARPLADVWMPPWVAGEGPLSRDDLQDWFAPVPGHRGRLSQSRKSDFEYGVLEGVFRLRAPWGEDVVWKLDVRESDKFFLHLFHGEQGVTLRQYAPNNEGWAAYVTRREPGQPRPSSFCLAATDGYRTGRTEARYAAAFLIWYRAGEVVVSAGDVVLLRAPLAGPPTEVFFEGKVLFDGLAPARVQDLPPAAADFPVVATIDRPADLSWLSELPEGAELVQCDDGAVDLKFDKPKGSGWIAAALPHEGLGVVDLLIEEATPGASLFLGAAERVGDDGQTAPEGKPDAVVSVGINERAKRLSLHERSIGDWGIGKHSAQIESSLERCVRPPFYVRLLASPGKMRFWMSPDGRHWAGPFALQSKEVGNLRYVGLGFGNGLDQPGHIKLRRIVQRELPALTSLVSPEVLQRGIPAAAAKDMNGWSVEIMERKPADLDLASWRRACALRTLGAGCRDQVGNHLLECLLDDAATMAEPQQRFAILEEAALLTGTWGGDDTARRRLVYLLDQYRRIAAQAIRTNDEPQPFSLIRAPMMSAPIATEIHERVFEPALIRDEIVKLAYRQDGDRVDRLVSELEYFSGSQDYFRQVAPLADWARITTGSDRIRAEGNASAAPSSSRNHPVVEQLNKEAYNVHAELLVALASDAWGDACRYINSVGLGQATGLVPSHNDPALLVSLHTAIRNAMRQDPDLQEVMVDEFASVGRVRLQQAIAQNDPAAVEAIAVQFYGTPAAADAHQWLGDRDLSGGQFAEALNRYRRAAAIGGESPDAECAPRIRLAAAMIGVDVGASVTGPVSMGSLVIPAADFEKLVAEMRSAHAPQFVATSPEPTLVAGWGTAPEPASYKFQERARWDAFVGDDRKGDPPHIREREIHWLDRQLAPTVADNMLYVSTRFQVAAFDLQSGQRKWLSAPVPDTGNALDWPLVPMRPLIAADRVFVRQLSKRGPVLMCLDRANGQPKWGHQEPGEELAFSDPFMIQGQLFALTLEELGTNADRLHLTQFDRESGQVLQRYPVVRLRDSWQDYHVCQVTPTEDALIVVLSGSILSLDHHGNVQWLRRQTLLGPRDDQDWIRQDQLPPLLHQGRLYVVGPGVRSLDCIEPQTGALLWRRVMPTVERLMGIAGGRLIVQTGDAIVAIDPASGEPAWWHDTVDPLPAQLCGPRIVYSRRIAWEPARNLRTPELVWLDAERGVELAVHPIAEAKDDWPRFAALIANGDRLWGIFGRGEERNRVMAELVASGEATPVAPAPQSLDTWLSHLPAPLHEATQVVLPAWNLISTRLEDATPLGTANGENDVLRVRASSGSPVVLARELDFPKLGRPQLKARVSGQNGQMWRIVVHFRGEEVFSREMSEGTKWQDLDINLAALRGQQGVITIRGEFLDGGEFAEIFWKSLQLVY